MIGKDQVGSVRVGGTVVDWLMRFWSPGRFESRWEAGPRALIRGVTCTIAEPSDDRESPSPKVLWQDAGAEGTGIDSGFATIQVGVDMLVPGRLYQLEFDVAADSMYRSAGPAGPTTGRTDVDELPPWIGKSDLYDYQVRPARFWFEVEPRSGGVPGNQIKQIADDVPEDRVRPTPARARLLPNPTTGVNDVEVDWRPDWLRRGRSQEKKTFKTDIVPSGKQDVHGGAPTHVVLHQTSGAKAKPGEPKNVHIIGAALNQFMNREGTGGVHYIIDYDGHVIKMCPDIRALSHANVAEWRGVASLNRRSVGIEHCHCGDDAEFPAEQIRASRNLVRQLKQAFGIDGRHIVGHGEIRCIEDGEAKLNTLVRTPPGSRTAQDEKDLADIRARKSKELKQKKPSISSTELDAAVEKYIESLDLGFDYDFEQGHALHPHSRLGSCPGVDFDWRGLADAKIVPAWPQPFEPDDEWKKSNYGGIFTVEKKLESNASASARGPHIRELHDDLRAIGYAIPLYAANEDGQLFTAFLANAVRAFKARHMQDLRLNDDVDATVAWTIKAVVAEYSRGPI